MSDPAASIGAHLLEALYAADDALKSVWAEWDRLPRNPGGWIDQEIRDDYWERREQADAVRAEAASQCFGYFEGRGHYTGPGHASAEELAAWELIQRRSWTAPVTPIMNRPHNLDDRPQEADDGA